MDFVMDFGIIDVGGKVWGPFTAPTFFSKAIGKSSSYIGECLKKPIRRFSSLSNPFVVLEWKGSSFNDYNLPPVNTWKQASSQDLKDFRALVESYVDPYYGPSHFSDLLPSPFLLQFREDEASPRDSLGWIITDRLPLFPGRIT